MKGLFRKLLLLGFACGFTLLLMEGMIRITGLVPPHGYPKGLFIEDPDTEFIMAPGFPETRFSKQEFETTVFTNRDGFRDVERPEPKPEGVYRVLVVGDSFVWGAYGVDADQTFTALAEQSLNRNADNGRPKFEVINAGVIGWGTDNALAFLKSRWDRYQPDAVVIAFCVANDFFDNMRSREYSVKDGYLVETDSLGSDHLLRRVRNWMVSHFRLVSLAERVVFQMEAFKPFLKQQEAIRFHGKDQMEVLYGMDQDEQASIRDRTEELLRQVAVVCIERGAHLSLMPIPSRIQVETIDKDASPVDMGLSEAQLCTPDKVLESMCERVGIDFVPSLESFRNASADGSLYWELNPHFNPAGNEVAAAILGAHLAPLTNSQ
ncbi:MAG: SGNH/GDSL hydrolase family protein [Opitutales bacterium]|nr:SGNH/GDSL hydrolase family protein [Opitutales bacterium]